MIGSSQGGMNIEDVARDSPDAIKTLPINIDKGVTKEECLEFAKSCNFEDLSEQAADMMVKLYDIFISKDATTVSFCFERATFLIRSPHSNSRRTYVVCTLQIEINPLAEDSSGKRKFHSTEYSIKII